MLKILIADDNGLTRESLLNTVPWEEWGYIVIAEAQNGIEALEKIQHMQPDIAILDISMPGMTGIEIAEKLNKAEKKPIIIFLTAYDRFSYARAGLKLGVLDYILKPADDVELKSALDRAAERIRQEKQEISSQNHEEGKASMEYLLLEGIQGKESSSMKLQEYMKVQCKAKGYELLMLNTSELDVAEVEMKYLPKLKCDLMEYEKKNRVKILIQRVKEGIVILEAFQTVRFTKDYNLLALKLASFILERADTAGYSIFIGISDFRENLKEHREMYEEAVFAENSRFFLENKKIVHYKSITSKSVHNEYVLSKTMQELFRTLYQQPEDFLGKLDELLELICQDDRYNEEYVKNIFTQIAFNISNYFYDKGKGRENVKSLDMILREVNEIGGMKQLILWLKNYAQLLVHGMDQENLEISLQTQRALDYVNTHYMEHICLADVANSLGISESYLCRLLKSDTGETFVNILNKIRVQKAEKLLKTGKYKVYEIAEIVGFNNYAYFFQVFKKITGESPKNCQSGRGNEKEKMK